MDSFSRRKLLGDTSRAIAASALPYPGADSSESNRRKLKVIVAGGHPGDPEYGCGGTIARYTDLGHEVVLLYLTRGEAGSPKLTSAQTAAMRISEAAKACKLLNARPAYAGQSDGNAMIDPRHYDKFRKLLETEQPDLVFTQWPIDNHRDHRATSMLTYDAWLHMNKKFALYYYEVSNGEDTMMFSPTDYVDITAVVERKRAACFAHASQAPDKFYALQSEVTRFRGLESGYAEAEAYVRYVESRAALLPDEL